MLVTTETPSTDKWSKRLAIGIPVLVLMLVVTSSLLVGTVLNIGDLEERYTRLVADAEAAAAAAEESAPAGDAPAAAPAAPAPAERPEITANLVLTEFGITADLSEVPAWATVTFEVRNDGALPHDASIDGTGTPMLGAGASGSFTVDAPASGELELVCTVAGHAEAGMRLLLPVGGDDDAAGQG